MRMKASFLLLLFFSTWAFAEKPWPKRVKDAKFAQLSADSLPEKLRESLQGFDEFSQGGDHLSETYSVCRIDLNGDGIDEFIVQSNQSYSGGSMMYIFTLRKGRFIEIGDLQGGIYFAAKINGFHQIVSEGRAGGGMFTRTLDRYEKGRYRIVRIADYRSVDDNTYQFVRERNPKEYDN